MKRRPIPAERPFHTPRALGTFLGRFACAEHALCRADPEVDLYWLPADEFHLFPRFAIQRGNDRAWVSALPVSPVTTGHYVLHAWRRCYKLALARGLIPAKEPAPV